MITPPLILKSFSPSRWFPLPHLEPVTVVVLTYGEDERRTFTMRPSRSERRGARRADVVDIRPQRVPGELRLPAQGDVYYFVVTVEAVWRVVDPAAMIEAHMHSPRGAVLTALDQRFRPKSRLYEGHDADRLEQHLNSVLSGGWDIGSGLQIVQAHTWVAMDPRLTSRRLTHDANHFDADEDQHLISIRVEYLRRVMKGNADGILLHLARYPEDTHHVLQAIIDAQERDRAARLDLLEKLIGEGFILDAYVEPLRSRVLGISTDSTWAGRWVSVSELSAADGNGIAAQSSENVAALLPVQSATSTKMTGTDGPHSSQDETDEP